MHDKNVSEPSKIKMIKQACCFAYHKLLGEMVHGGGYVE